jgi:hypothetical protein
VATGGVIIEQAKGVIAERRGEGPDQAIVDRSEQLPPHP